MTPPPDSHATDRLPYFESLYDGNEDPYGLRTRWYEERKRNVLLGAGELTVALAARCDTVLAADFNAGAVASARKRTAGLANVRIASHQLPGDWPRDEAPFDLIVVSELGYFLEAPAMESLAELCAATMTPEGVLVACDWRPDFAERALPTDAVHGAFARTGLARMVRHVEDDFLLELWCSEPRSVAQREGIR